MTTYQVTLAFSLYFLTLFVHYLGHHTKEWECLKQVHYNNNA